MISYQTCEQPLDQSLLRRHLVLSLVKWYACPQLIALEVGITKHDVYDLIYGRPISHEVFQCLLLHWSLKKDQFKETNMN